MTSIKPDKNEQEPVTRTAASRETDDETEDMDTPEMPYSDLPTSLNEELDERISDDPNKFIGCGG